MRESSACLPEEGHLTSTTKHRPDHSHPSNHAYQSISPQCRNPKSAEPATVDQLTERNIQLAQLENSAQAKRTMTDRLVDAITGFCGRMLFVYVHIAWFGVWIVLNLMHIVKYDPYPFNLLTLVVSLEAIFLKMYDYP